MASRLIKLPSKPILDLVEGRGGLEGIMLAYRDRHPEIDWSSAMDAEGYCDPTNHPIYTRIERGLERGLKSGQFTLWWADDFCCKFLGKHPCLVYGAAYWDIQYKHDNGHKAT